MGQHSGPSMRWTVALALLAVLIQNNAVLSEECIPAQLEHGLVDGEGGSEFWIGNFSCLPGYTLVGAATVKCIGGTWSSAQPKCVGIGMCDPEDLPSVKNARLIALKQFRSSVYKYSCMKGYERYGQGKVHCGPGGLWDLGKPPVCTKLGCDETQITELRYGKYKKLADGAAYRFQCNEGSILQGSDMVYCDGVGWNDTTPRCLTPAGPPHLSLESAAEDGVIRAGDLVTVACEASSGQPLPSLQLFLNGQLLASHQVEEALDSSALSYVFEAKPTHHGARLTCSAVNSLMEAPAEAEPQYLEVLHAAGQPLLQLMPPHGVRAGEEMTVSCQGHGGHPAPELRLYLGEQQLHEEEEEAVTAGRSSSYTFVASPEQNGLAVTCHAQNDVMEAPAVATQRLEVLYPSSEPLLLLDPQSPIHAGEEVRLTCSSESGNPAPTLTLLLGEEQLGEELEAVTATFIASTQHQGMLVSCLSINPVMTSPVETNQALEILYGPEMVSVSGPDHVEAGKSADFRCTSSPAKPSPVLEWRVQSSRHGEITDFQVTSELADGSTSSSSRLQLPARPHGPESLTITCSCLDARGQEVHTELVVDSHYPPETVSVDGSDRVKVGEELLATCHSGPSLPPAQLHWVVTKGGIAEHIPADQTVEALQDGGYETSADLAYPVILSENDKEEEVSVSCHASHPMLGEDSLAYDHHVHIFRPPSQPSIVNSEAVTEEPNALEAGTSLHLTCSAIAGNPPAVLVWHHSEDLLAFQSVGEVLYSGGLAISEAVFTVRERTEDTANEAFVSCEVMNEALEQPLQEKVKYQLAPVMVTEEDVNAAVAVVHDGEETSGHDNEHGDHYEASGRDEEHGDHEASGIVGEHIDQNNFCEDHNTVATDEDHENHESYDEESADDMNAEGSEVAEVRIYSLEATSPASKAQYSSLSLDSQGAEAADQGNHYGYAVEDTEGGDPNTNTSDVQEAEGGDPSEEGSTEDYLANDFLPEDVEEAEGNITEEANGEDDIMSLLSLERSEQQALNMPEDEDDGGARRIHPKHAPLAAPTARAAAEVTAGHQAALLLVLLAISYHRCWLI